MVRVAGIDPGTGSWDIFGLEGNEHGEQVFLDISLPTKKILQEPGLLLDILERNRPLDMIVAPSGHGIPLKPLTQVTDDDIFKANLRKDSDPTIMGIARVLHALRDTTDIPAHVIPGVKHLGSVKRSFKFNKIDMGTADKVCCAAAGIVDQARTRGIPFAETGFIMVEVGMGFNAYLAIEHGRIIDGIGGSLGGMGFTAAGALDGEIAYLLDHVSKKTIYGGGLAQVAGYEDMSPRELFLMARKDAPIAEAVDGFFHDMVRGITSLLPSFSDPSNAMEILVSGRATSEVLQQLEPRIPSFIRCPARAVRSVARISKVAAQGAAFIANGLAGGRYKELVDVMALHDSNRDLLADIYVGNLRK